jgi:hypothetical protein
VGVPRKVDLMMPRNPDGSWSCFAEPHDRVRVDRKGGGVVVGMYCHAAPIDWRDAVVALDPVSAIEFAERVIASAREVLVDMRKRGVHL